MGLGINGYRTVGTHYTKLDRGLHVSLGGQRALGWAEDTPLSLSWIDPSSVVFTLRIRKQYYLFIIDNMKYCRATREQKHNSYYYVVRG